MLIATDNVLLVLNKVMDVMIKLLQKHYEKNYFNSVGGAVAPHGSATESNLVRSHQKFLPLNNSVVYFSTSLNCMFWCVLLSIVFSLNSIFSDSDSNTSGLGLDGLWLNLGSA